MTLAAISKHVQYKLAKGRPKSGYNLSHGLTRKKRRRQDTEVWQDRKLKRAVNRSFEAISDSTSFGRRREMTTQEKPHWSAEIAHKNTVHQPLLYPSKLATLREKSSAKPSRILRLLLRRLTASFRTGQCHALRDARICSFRY